MFYSKQTKNEMPDNICKEQDQNQSCELESDPESKPFQDSGSEYVHSESKQGSSTSDSSSENDQEDMTVKNRKRSKGKNVNSSNWDRNKNKFKRMKGEN